MYTIHGNKQSRRKVDYYKSYDSMLNAIVVEQLILIEDMQICINERDSELERLNDIIKDFKEKINDGD